MSVVLSENLPLLASAPGGIQKLRGLILELAVRGKLVRQDPDDEPASELLKRIAQERALLAKEGVRTKSKTTLLTEKIERPFKLPDNWAWTNLATVALINPRNAADDSIEASFVPMAMIGNRFEGSHQQELRKWGEVKQGFTHFAEGDIGVAKITPCFENSKACVFEGLENGIGAGTTELHVVRPIGQTLAPRYVLAYLKAPMFLLVGETKMTGTAGQKRLPKDFLEANPFPLPPLAEQHRIVTKVDELMALCDRLEGEQADAASAHDRLVETLLGTLTQSTDAADLAANWQRLAEHFDTLFTTEASIDALKQTVLQLAVMGKLVPQDPRDESACLLLGRIELERSRMVEEGKCKKSKPVPPIEEAELPFRAPEGWRWARWGDITHWMTYGFTRPMPHVNSGPTILTAKNIFGGSIDFENVHFTTDEAFGALSAKDLPSAGDILITKDGSIGRAAVVPPDAPKFCINQSVAVLWLRNIPVNRHFLVSAIHSALLQERIWAAAEGAAIKHISITDFVKFPLPLPPLAEQHRIVAKVDELMALCDRLKADLASARQHQALLADTLIESALEAA